MNKRPAQEEENLAVKRTRSATNGGEDGEVHDQNAPSEVQSGPRPSAVAPSELFKNAEVSPATGARRRTNPDSLAGRLGSDLVKELEALLQPEMTQMPSFAVRQTIQKRFNVDRRHIYDWFHSKGLRVAPSEQRAERLALKAKKEHVISARMHKKNKPIETAPRPTPRSDISGSTKPPSNLAAPSTPVRTGGVQHFDGMYGMQHTGFSPYQAMDSYLDTGFMTLAPDSTYGSFYYPLYSVPLHSERARTPPTVPNANRPKTSLERTSDWIAEQQKIPYEPGLYAPSPVPQYEEPSVRDNLDVILPLDEEQALPQHEREAYYRCLSDVLPPARGIEECVGTYKAYMSQMNQTYFEKLISGNDSVSAPLAYSSALPTGPSTLSPEQNSALFQSVNVNLAPYYATAPASQAPVISEVTNPASGTITGGDFSKWFLHGSRSYPPSHVPSPSQTPSLCDTSSTSLSSALWSNPNGFDHTRQPSAASCLDIADILESPILHSRKATANEAFNLTHTIVSAEAKDASPPCGFLTVGYEAAVPPAMHPYTAPTLAANQLYDYNQMAPRSFVPFYPSHVLPAAPPAVPIVHHPYPQDLHRVTEKKHRTKGKGVAKAQSGT